MMTTEDRAVPPQRLKNMTDASMGGRQAAVRTLAIHIDLY